MSVKPTREQLPFYNRFRRLVSDDSFINDIDLLRASKEDILQTTHSSFEEFDDGTINSEEVPSPLHQVMIKYNLPLVMENFIYHYVVHNEVDLSKLRNGVYLIDNESMKASGNNNEELNYQAYVDDTRQHKYVEITLAIPVHATITQINETISQHKQFIKDRQVILNNNKPIQRVKVYPEKIQRNKEIMRLYEKGLEPSEIAEALFDSTDKPLIGSDVSKIIYKEKNKPKKYRP